MSIGCCHLSYELSQPYLIVGVEFLHALAQREAEKVVGAE